MQAERTADKSTETTTKPTSPGRNNLIFTDDPGLFASEAGFDGGISLWSACEATVIHNTVYSTEVPFASIEWRFESTSGVVANNLVSHNLMERTAHTATAFDNIEDAEASHFVDASAGDLHLASGSAAVDAGADLGDAAVSDDVDGEARDDGAPDIGADEIAGGP